MFSDTFISFVASTELKQNQSIYFLLSLLVTAVGHPKHKKRNKKQKCKQTKLN